MREIRDQVRPEALALGIEVVDVRIRRTDLMPEVLNDTYERMNAERFAEAAELRAVGQAEAARIRAEADREAVELVAKSRREGEIVRGEGDGERNKVFAEAFQKDPEFFSFYRSMQAYAKSLADAGTTLVLSPTSEFFKYFGGKPIEAPTGTTPPAPSGERPPVTPPAQSGSAPAVPLNEAPAAANP
jgi:membrane protease subunit HflC